MKKEGGGGKRGNNKSKILIIYIKGRMKLSLTPDGQCSSFHLLCQNTVVDHGNYFFLYAQIATK